MASLSLLYVVLVIVGLLISAGLVAAGQLIPVIGYWFVILWFVVAVYAVFFRKREADRLLET
jgi:CHASE2 domain-containing sensor protein